MCSNRKKLKKKYGYFSGLSSLMKMCAATTYECMCASIMPFFRFFLTTWMVQFRSLGLASSCTSSFSAGVYLHKFIFSRSNIDAYDAIGNILYDMNVDTEVNYVYFNHLTLLNEQIYLIDSISIFQMAKFELWLDKAKVREVTNYQFFKVIQ